MPSSVRKSVQGGLPSKPSKTSCLPKDWPSKDIVYLRVPCYSKNLAKEAINKLIVPKADIAVTEELRKPVGPYSHVRITPITDKAHPAYSQFGLFASSPLAAGSFILEYLGFIHDNTDLDEASDYDLSLEREFSIGVDAASMGNEARFINDYRGVSDGPNAEFRDIFVDLGNGKVEKRMGVFVLGAGKSGKRSKGITKGTEIVVSYGRGFWSERKSSVEG
ncbi:hypothetical protein B0J11DRAFT_86334 [Dendryphion nanum]|uniref:SET domain-containing protein n=1 Tax=Dendryphion nanum TaxID=256645 RepID=A0A9P9DH66_9PLEO|nr:hypothetical protein B0J11DRAFT_86334 [Dendryphion nanum]